jgi:hypothetical protein
MHETFVSSRYRRPPEVGSGAVAESIPRPQPGCVGVDRLKFYAGANSVERPGEIAAAKPSATDSRPHPLPDSERSPLEVGW